MNFDDDESTLTGRILGAAAAEQNAAIPKPPGPPRATSHAAGVTDL